eukprot:7266837-Alexandrium_andersonii.AAC.1
MPRTWSWKSASQARCAETVAPRTLVCPYPREQLGFAAWVALLSPVGSRVAARGRSRGCVRLEPRAHARTRAVLKRGERATD